MNQDSAHQKHLIIYKQISNGNDELNGKPNEVKIELHEKNINLKKFKFKLFIMNFKEYLKPIIIAQVLSFLICGTGVVTSLLSDSYQINIPTFQSVFNYILLAIIFIPSWILSQNDGLKIKNSIKKNWWKYFFISLADVEANYFIIKAYSLTIMTTIQVIDAFILPITLALSYFLLKQSFKLNHYLGVFGCLFGCAFIIVADFFVKGPGDNHQVQGDLYCLLGSVLYAISNVGAELSIKENSKREYLAMIGFFGSVISSVQMAIFERSEVSNLTFNNLVVWGLFGLESVFMFLIYTLIPCVIELSSAAFLNVNLLTSDFYSVLYGIFIKKYIFHPLYFAGFACILLGTILYSLSDPKSRISKNVHNGEPGSENNQIEVNLSNAISNISSTTTNNYEFLVSENNKKCNLQK